MTIASELNEILQMRLSPAYQAAEAVRQAIGAAQMASSPPSTAPYGALRLMVGTWDTIAIRVRGNSALKVPFFQTNPVGFMWDKLLPGIKVVRGEFKGRAKANYAREFESLNRSYRKWLKSLPASYQSAAMQGINAQFG
jgi:hypothetical protein